MKKIFIGLIFIFCINIPSYSTNGISIQNTLQNKYANSQYWPPKKRLSVGFNLGIAFMQTDLAGFQLGNFHWDDIERFKPVFSMFTKMDFNKYFALTGELGYTSYWVEDAWIDPTGPNDPAAWRKMRNLSAGSNLFFANLMATFTPFQIEVKNKGFLSPFIGGGLGLIHFNPYTYYQGDKIFLKALQIEGKDYSLWTMSFPVIGGFEYSNKKHSFAVYMGWDVTRSDYIDDVSTDNFTNYDKLEGLAKELSFRHHEIGVETMILDSQNGRGDPNDFDQLWYFKIRWGIYLQQTGTRGNVFVPHKRNKSRCPKFRKAKRKGFSFL